MTELRRFKAMDLLHFNHINLDHLTETYNLSFYLSYLSTWPDHFLVQHTPTGRMMGYLMGKLEGRGKDWHSHVTAITVSPEYRRQGVARGLMQGFEASSDMYVTKEWGKTDMC
jgi:N-terminal acetyltransferase B complex catalytic subunit